MIVEGMLLAVLNDPIKRLPYPQTRAGISDEDKNVYIYALPSVPYPILSIPYKIEDKFGNTLSPGHYELALSDDRHFLLLIQSNQIIAKVPVAGREEKQVSEDEERQKAIEYEKQQKKNKKKKGKDTTELKKEVFRKAVIGDSKEGYYIIKYQNGNIKAWGYIPY